MLNSQVFTGSGTFNVPPSISAVWITAWAGGGGGGGWTGTPNTLSGGGGGQGEACYNVKYPVTPGGTVSVTVGAAGASTGGDGGNGGDTAFGNLVLRGGKGGGTAHPPTGGLPGTGGGVGHTTWTYIIQIGTKETSVFYGGSGGCDHTDLTPFPNTGAPSGPYYGGAQGGDDTGSGQRGGGGAGSIFGVGGAGGTCSTHAPPTVQIGNPAPVTSYGAGGGGFGSPQAGPATPCPGGAGAAGRVLITWIG